MIILAVDTSTSSGSVALLDNCELLGEIYLSLDSTHSERVLSCIDSLFHFLKMDISDVDLFVSSIGPGSFTGIRIGLSLLKGFATALSKPLTGVPSIDAVALEFPFYGNFYAFIEGRGDEIFYAQFEKSSRGIFRVSDYKIDKFSIIDNFENKIGVFKNKNLDKSIFKGVLYAHNFGILGYHKFNSLSKEENNILPLYLRKSDAEIAQN